MGRPAFAITAAVGTGMTPLLPAQGSPLPDTTPSRETFPSRYPLSHKHTWEDMHVTDPSKDLETVLGRLARIDGRVRYGP